MPSIYEAIGQFLNDDRWAHEPLVGQSVYRVFYQGVNGRLVCFAQARDTEQQFVFYAYCPAEVPPDQRPAIAEYLTRANYGLVLGNFEMDYQDGEVRFKTSIDVDGTLLTPQLIRPVIYANVLTMDEYLAGILSILQSGAAPDAALRQVLERAANPPAGAA